MIKNNIKYSITILFSFLSIYVLCDMLILPYIFYVEETTVPNVLNHNISTGQILLEKNKLDFRIQYIPSNRDEPIGAIINSVPLSGKRVKTGTIVDLKVLGEKETYTVPELLFKSKNIAINILKSMGIKIDTVFYDYWDILCTNPENININTNIDEIFNQCAKYKKNIVWKQFPESGQKVFKDKSITLYVSKGEYTPEFYSIPNLIDLDLDSALDKIKKSGLLIGQIEYVNSDLKIASNKVIDQFPYGECRITDKINLTVKK
jgi:beta-lactam-binding protein with PASTA domain